MLNPAYCGYKSWYRNEDLNKTVLGDFGKSIKAPFRQWILGKGFAFCLCYAINTYYELSSVEEIGLEFSKDEKHYYEALEYLAKDKDTLHTLDSRDECAIRIGLKARAKQQHLINRMGATPASAGSDPNGPLDSTLDSGPLPHA